MSGHYRIETHAHTAIVSPCGRLQPEELVAGYIRAGYSGIVITDHLAATLPILQESQSRHERVHRFFSGYRAVRDAARKAARKAAEASGRETVLTVYPAFELTFASLTGRDFLVYGIDEAMLREMPEVYEMEPAYFKRLATECGALVYQAHPYRNNGPVDPGLVDGLEVYNGNPRHDSQDHLAAAFAEQHGLLALSGSDAHQWEDVGRGGITLPDVPETIFDLADRLRAEPAEAGLLVPCEST